MKSEAKKFLYEDTIAHIKKELNVNFLDPQALGSVAEKAIPVIQYWESRKVKNPTPEYTAICDHEIAKLEALMQKVTDLSLDVYEVNAVAYLDTKGTTVDNSVNEVLTDVANKGVETKIADALEEGKTISIFDGSIEVETPKLSDLSVAVKALLKKGNRDTAELMATKYLSVGNYIPKKEKQTPDKWSAEKITSWIKDLGDRLMDEKVEVSKEIKNQEDKNTNKDKDDVTKNGLTAEEVEGLRLLEFVIPDAIAGHQDFQSRRDKLNSYLTLGETLNRENEMLWAVAKRIAGAQGKVKIPESELAKLYVDIDAFCKRFFAHRGYTEASVKLWRQAAKTTVGIPNFEYLTTNKDLAMPLKLAKSGVNYAAIDKRIAEEVLAGKTFKEILAGIEEGILYKVIEGKDEKEVYPIYTKLHAKDLIERMYSTHSAKPKVEPSKKSEAAATIITSDKSKVDIAEVKLLLSTLANAGAIIEDVKQHPEILNLIDREIQVDVKFPALKFGEVEKLFPYIEKMYAEIVSKLPKVAESDTLIPETAYADLDNMITLCTFAANNDVTQEDFIKEHKDLVVKEDGTYKSLMSKTSQGGSKTISISNEKDFEVWVNQIYKAIKVITAPDKKTDSTIVDSMKELVIKGKELLEKETTYEKFMDWLKANLLNRKMKEQKENGAFKSVDAIISFAKNTFKEKLPKPVASEKVKPFTESTIEKQKTVAVAEKSDKDKVVVPELLQTKLSVEEVNALIATAAKDTTNTFIDLGKMLRSLYKTNDILVNEHKPSGQEILEILDTIVEKANPTMHAERVARKATHAEFVKNQPEFKFEKTEKKSVEPPVEKIPEVEEKAEVIVEPEIVDVEHTVFETVDVQSVDPELWKLIEKFTTLDEVYNQALEFNETGKFNEALSMCLLIMPSQIEASKDWTPEQIQDWFNKNILKKSEPVIEEPVKAETEDAVVDPMFDELKESKNPKSFKHAIAEILKSKEDNKELRDQIINAINNGKGSHTRQVAKMPDKQKHEQINSIKDKIGKFSKVEQG